MLKARATEGGGMTRSLSRAAAVAVGAGAAHFATHERFGDSAVFGRAGVTQAGTAVVIAAFVLSLLVAQRGNIGLQPAGGPPRETRAERARRRLHPIRTTVPA